VPDFLEASVGGHFKRKSPTVAVSELIANWVATETLYIASSNNLCRRLHEFAEFGRGKPIGHRGGRYLWQLVDHDRLLVCWRPTANAEDPVDVETTLLGEFHDEHGSLPFANLSWPRRTARAA
jgi:hypothetical protein